MRAVSQELLRRLHRADPDAHEIVEIAAVEAEALKTTYDDWRRADSTAGVSISDEGIVRLSATVGTLAEHVLHDATTTELEPDSLFDAVFLEWDFSVDWGTQ